MRLNSPMCVQHSGHAQPFIGRRGRVHAPTCFYSALTSCSGNNGGNYMVSSGGGGGLLSRFGTNM